MPTTKRSKTLKKKTPHLKLIQGGKSTPKPVTKRTHPFAHFIGKSRTLTTGKPTSYEQTMHNQLPRKKAF